MGSMSTTFSDKYCQQCGSGLIRTAVVCPNCGSSTDVRVTGGIPIEGSGPAKSKTVAVVLAVVFGSWGWLYTFSRNKAKFFIALPFQLVNIYVQFGVIAITLNATVRGYDQEPVYSLIGSVVTLFTVFPFWLWAVIDMATKPNQYFTRYTKKRRA